MPVLNEHDLDTLLGEIVGRLRATFSPVAIYLYGSYAYGMPQPHSDLDLLVVVPSSDLHPYDRDAKAYMALLDVRFPIDVQVYTLDEFEARSALPVSFERTVRQKGRVIDAA